MNKEQFREMWLEKLRELHIKQGLDLSGKNVGDWQRHAEVKWLFIQLIDAIDEMK